MWRARFIMGLTAFFCFMGGLAVAEEPSVQVSINPQTVHVRERFMLTLNISGSPIQKIDIPDVDGIQVGTSPLDTSQSTTIISGVAQSTMELTYAAVASKQGRIMFPPVQVTIGGKVYKSDPIVFNVLGPRQPAPPPPPGGRPNPQQGRESLTWDDAVFLRAKVDKKEVYQGEAVKLTLSFWVLKDPTFEVRPQVDLSQEQINAVGFYVSNVGSRRYDDSYKGHPFQVDEYTKVLYPTGNGDLTIGSWKFQGIARLWGRGYQGHQYDLSTDAIHIHVKPLPNRPADFSGAVGTFKASAMLSRDQVVVGAPTNLVITVDGEGNPEAIGAPKLPTIANAHISDPESNVSSLNGQSNLAVEKSFKYQIIPNVAGTLHIPAVAFVYFDPAQVKYITEQTRPFELTVTPSPEGQQRIVVDGSNGKLDQKQGVAVLNSGIMPLATDPGPLYPGHGRAGLLFTGLSAPALAYVAFALFMMRKRRFEQDTRLARSHFARSRGRKRLAEVSQADDPAQTLYRALMGFIADKFDVKEGGLTSDDVRRLLTGSPLDQDVIESIIKTLKACERARYASVRLSAHEVTALLEASEMNMAKMDERLKKGVRA